MDRYLRMTPTQFGVWARENLTEGKCVDFALDENGYKVSDTEALAKGDADLENWWFATIVEFPQYYARVLLINYAGGGTPYAVEVDEHMETSLEVYFRDVNDDYDDDHKIVVDLKSVGCCDIEVSIEDGDGRVLEYTVSAVSVYEAKKEARRLLDEFCAKKRCKVGEITVQFNISQDNGEYLDSDEATANWDGKRVIFYEDL